MTEAAGGSGRAGGSRGRWLLPVLLPPLVFALLYARSIDYELTWTDRHAIVPSFGGNAQTAGCRKYSNP